MTTSPTVETERVVLVIDQFEECFTMCQDSQEREEFFNCLLETLEQAQHKLCLVLGMRADFLGKCAEYAELAQKIDQHLVMVKPMTRQEIEEAITKPAELVDLQVEKALVTKMTEDVVESPGTLPLLKYTLTQLEGHKSGIASVIFNANGRQLASFSGDNNIKLWNAVTGQEIASFSFSEQAGSKSFSPDGRQLVSASSDRSIIIWDVAKRQKINVLNGHKAEVNRVSFSPDGQLLASGSADGTVILWNYKILSKLTLDDLLARGCDWVRGYLQNNRNVSKSDRHLCDGIGTGK